MGKLVVNILVVVAVVVSMLMMAIGLATDSESARVNTPLTTAPVEVRFGLKGEWTGWQALPPPGQASCEKGAVADRAEVRIRPTFEGYYVSISGAVGQKILADGTEIRIEGIGRATVAAGTAGGVVTIQTYFCDLVLTK